MNEITGRICWNVACVIDIFAFGQMITFVSLSGLHDLRSYNRDQSEENEEKSLIKL